MHRLGVRLTVVSAALLLGAACANEDDTNGEVNEGADAEEERNEQAGNNEENSGADNEDNDENGDNEDTADADTNNDPDEDNDNDDNQNESAAAAANNEENENNAANDAGNNNNDSGEVETDSGLDVHFIDVDQADATLFEVTAPENDTYRLLFDTGDWNQTYALDYLEAQGITELDAMITSHPHADHIGGVDQIMDAGITVHELWMSGEETDTDTFERALDAAETHDVDLIEPRTGDEFTFGPLELEVVNPDRLTGDLHESSLAVRFDYGDVSLLFTGDAEDTAEARMAEKGEAVDADILQLGHHGSATSTTAPFLDAVDPSTAIYSAGEGNTYGHPHAEVIDRVKEAGIDLYGTDAHGTVRVESDGEDYTVETEHEGEVAPGDDGGSAANDDGAASESENGASLSEGDHDPAAGDCIDINSAPADELEEIHQIGEARAQELKDLRPFDSLSGLDAIDGIGDARVEEIEEEGLACVD
ncbi:MBL fold metallo-hydrolase [Salisediminibacterium halotolerans]|uniref:Competence protein ComEC n=1 Tax=Salisediminibacterium halotolerans TaxID=517425 RepID=A0A1H9U7M5_9BACI|nr:MBL fold metallo-hydrolase [Salisediminibacterium haloalkalitolerans]SES05103.1 competence protein ComEC [Salisediminibacterium haloalkalitolerans]